MAERNTPTAEDLKAPLFAAVGAADLALERVNEIVTALRERAGDARTDASDRVEETRGRIAKLREELPQRSEELRGRLSGDELRRAAESYREQATELYNELIERGEAALERLRSQPGFEERRAQAEKRFSDTVELTQEALGSVASQTRAVGERAAKLIGREPAKKGAKKAAPAKQPAKKTAAKKAAAKK
ncbi:MAG: heparin-binding hemagglutinin, partial [Mycobacteriaceae bacterium]|nr:heparin-binding hemagglutinin [Mycobacteriaceae bacterium]